ncbi:alpha/beta fold hydrolase [Rhodophyticola porphyridii]|uniref:Alpha/beta fold hydrolase n=1 Tax=Rhodophyticola porphyridii TaxID=1852017 RepID=A0A3L9XVP3_9RHOB|nr:alpha/beta fold hydrolase [Rhodophyticola porphyridii]RMA40681.1 alpha/beta fold hydrolase [Rhodophyticola porphyridii]
MIYAFEQFTIDTYRFQLSGPEGAIDAEPQALEFLIHMIRNRGQLVTKDMLHETFWPDRVVSDAALSTLVRNARRLVGDSGDEQRVIATRHGRGFVFRAEVEEREAPVVVGEAMRDAVSPARPRVEGAPAIIVLPFEIVGDTADTQGLSEGVTEEVMAALARTRWFPMVARNRVRTFLELPPEARHPFRELGATYLVEGGVFRDGDDVRLHLQLTDTEPALHIHVSRHDLAYDGLFRLLDEISTIVTATVLPELLEAERIKAEAIERDDRNAWQEFVLGQHLIAAPDKSANTAARSHFRRALSLEPGSGRIHAGLAMTHLWDYKYDWSDSAELSLASAARDAERALALSPDDSWAWSILAICKLTLRRFDAAVASAGKAIDVDPASAMAYGCQSWVLAYSGRYEEALAAFDRAMQLSPNDRRRGLWLTGKGIAQFGLGDFEGALDSARALISLSPDHPSGHRMKCASLASLDRLVEARRAAAALMGLLPHHDVDAAVARQPFKTDLGPAYADALKKAGLQSGKPETGPAVAATEIFEPYPVRYATTPDGVRIAWSRMGSGPPLIASVSWIGHLGRGHANPLNNRIVQALAERFTLIQFDHRGMGLSEREIEGTTLRDFARDIETVAKAAELDRFALFAMAHGCAVALEYLEHNPGHVSRLALYGATSTGWRHPEWGETTERTEAIIAIARLGWDAEEPVFRKLTLDAVLPDKTGIDTGWLYDHMRDTIRADVSVQIIEAIADFDFRSFLPRIEIPTVVLHASGDRAVPVDHGKAVADTIPGARFVEVPSSNHILTQTEPHWRETLDTVMDFLDGI